MNVAIVWFRNDLRLADNPSISAATKAAKEIVPLFIWSPEEDGRWEPGSGSKWWLAQSLKALETSLVERGSRLIVRRGESLPTLLELAKRVKAEGVFWNSVYEPARQARDERVKKKLQETGLQVETFNGSLLFEPGSVKNQSGKPFQVFTPFWRHCLKSLEVSDPLPIPKLKPDKLSNLNSTPIEDLHLEPAINWTAGMAEAWDPGERGAHKRVKKFTSGNFGNYTTTRNLPDLEDGTSKLSPHLHFGEISPRQVWKACEANSKIRDWRASQYITELGWREFAHQLLFNFPHTTDEPLRKEFSQFPWRKNKQWLRAWQKGMTGYPIVDAGMRELWTTGWMHNRVRMIVASFLVKDLLLDWREGARWFWDTLVDADLAQNTLGWQWTAGCGADAAPFFRIFNPTTQGEKFDPEGTYVRKWCPELANLPAKYIHNPSQAPKELLSKAGLKLGKDYPEPIIFHAIAREVALEAFKKLKAPGGR